MTSASPAIRKRQRAALAGGLVATVLVTAVLIISKVVQILLFFDAETGLLRRDPLSGLLGGVELGGLFLLLLAALVIFWPIRAIRADTVPLVSGSPALAVGILFMGACFMGQSVADLLTGAQTANQVIDVMGSVVSILGFCSGVCMLLAAQRLRAASRRPGMGLLAFPLLWNMLLIIRLLLSASDGVSVQASGIKTIAALFALLYFYDLLRQITGLGARGAEGICCFFRIAVPGCLLALSLPYLIAWMLGTRDAVLTVPYIALLGLGVFSGIRLFQMSAKAFRALHPDGEGEQ